MAAEAPRSLAAMFTTRYGIPSAPQDLLLDRQQPLVLGRPTPPGSTNENISTLSNWCTRKMPFVSLPAAPASRRKQAEKPA